MPFTNTTVIVDGECNFCNANASYIRKRQLENSTLEIITSQSSEGKYLLKKYGVLSSSQSIVLIENGIVSTQFNAVVKLTNHLNITHIARIIIKSIPLSLGNFLYSVVAKYRYIFGRRKCTNASINKKCPSN